MNRLTGLVTVVLSLVLSETAQACYVCFSEVKDDPMNIALNRSMFVLLGVISLVLVLLAKFFLGIRQREKLMMESQ